VENSLGGSARVSGMTEIIIKTEEWSEFKSRILLVKECRLLGILAEKMSRMSGFLLGAVGQYVGPVGGGARTLICLSYSRLYSTIPRGMLARQPQI